MAWCLWNNRNKVWYGEARKNGKSIAKEARKYWAEVQTVKPSFGRPSKPKITHKHWYPPPHGWYKVNADIAVFKDQGQCGIDVVIRNNQGLIMGAMCKLVEFPMGALEDKVKAMEAGIGPAWDLGLKHIILKGDAQLIIHALKGYMAPAKTILKIIEGSRNFPQKFSSWKAGFFRK